MERRSLSISEERIVRDDSLGRDDETEARDGKVSPKASSKRATRLTYCDVDAAISRTRRRRARSRCVCRGRLDLIAREGDATGKSLLADRAPARRARSSLEVSISASGARGQIDRRARSGTVV